MTTGQAAPSFEALGVANASAYTIFRLIDRVSILPHVKTLFKNANHGFHLLLTAITLTYQDGRWGING